MLKQIQSLDEKILRSISKFRTPVFDKAMIFFTNLGTKGFIWLVIGLVLLTIKDHKKNGVYIFVTVSFSALMSEVVIKNIIRRKRPCHNLLSSELLIIRPTSYSFPSGHATSSFASALLMMHAYSFAGPIFTFGLVLLATAISFSRLYLKVHYPSDILGGMLLGFFCSNVVMYVL